MQDARRVQCAAAAKIAVHSGLLGPKADCTAARPGPDLEHGLGLYDAGLHAADGQDIGWLQLRPDLAYSRTLHVAYQVLGSWARSHAGQSHSAIVPFLASWYITIRVTQREYSLCMQCLPMFIFSAC